MSRAALRAALTAAAAACAACAGCASTAAAVPGIRASSEGEVRGVLAARSDSVKSLRARASFKAQFAEGLRIGASMNISMRKPSDVRVEFLGPFFELEGLFIVRDGMYVFISMQERAVSGGTATPEAMAGSLGIPLSPADLLAVLSGGLPRGAVERGAVAFDAASGEVTVSEGAGGRVFTLEPSRLGLKRIECCGTGGTGYSVEVSEHSTAGGLPLPKRMRIASGGRIRSIEIRAQEFEVNPPVADAEFEAVVPQGFTFK